MSKTAFDVINKAAIDFWRTKDRKYFEVFAKAAIPLIKARAYITCTGSIRWDPDELFSILLADMWRLFNSYVPEEGKKFHWLMYRQLSNKTINYINKLSNNIFEHIPDITNYSPVHFDRHPDYLRDLADKEVVERLLKILKENDLKTYKVVTLHLAGYSKTEIGNHMDVRLPQNALNQRLKKCRKLITKIMGDSICI